MSRTLTIGAIVLCLLLCACSQTTWHPGEMRDIVFSASAPDPRANLLLYDIHLVGDDDPMFVKTIQSWASFGTLTEHPPGVFTYHWEVPNDIPLGDSYRLRLSVIDTCKSVTVSESGTFTIGEQGDE